MTKYIGIRLKWALIGAIVIIGFNSLGISITVNIWQTPVSFLGGKIGE